MAGTLGDVKVTSPDAGGSRRPLGRTRLLGEHRHPSAPVPPAGAAQVWIDFDGTITQRDVLDDLIQRYAVSDAWKLIEERWQAGIIGSRDCLREEFNLIRINRAELAEFLQTVSVDPGLTRLQGILRKYRVPVAVLSDGIDHFISAVLSRHGVTDIPIRSNTLVHRGDRLSLRCPHASPACSCAAAHCKCASAEQLLQIGRKTIYIGDGRSDLCPSRKANAVFAKGALAQALMREAIPFTPFVTLNDVANTLEAAWSVTSPVAAPRLGDSSELIAPRSA
jgi:2-hydroxy-3-keto-5-methylthiopentenyl-1-phosphate phosphatase